MKTATKLMLAGACVAAMGAAAAAVAQPTTAPRATLYEYPNFQGRSITIYGDNSNLANSNFNDMAMSGHFDGDWTVCADAYMRGQCTRVAGDVANLDRQGMGRTISSLQSGGPGGERWGDNDRRGDDRYDDNADDDRRAGGYPGGPGPVGPGGAYPGGGYPGGGAGGWGGEGTQGRSVVFFPRPQSNGQDIAAYDRGAADWFCRRQGLGAAVYYDTSMRGRGWRWQNNLFSMNAPVLRDVLCRKR